MENGKVQIDGFNCVLFIILIIVLFGCVVVSTSQRDTLKRDAILLGYAEHNAKSGQWQWITNNINTNVVNTNIVKIEAK